MNIWSTISRYGTVLVLLVAIFVYFSVSQSNFFTSANLQNMLAGLSILWVVSVGMTFVVLTGGIDLSVGALLALSGLILSKLFNGAGIPALLAVLLTIAVAMLIGGGVNGVLIGRAGLSFFVVTLGTMSIYFGIVNIWSKTQTSYVNSSLVDGIGYGKGLGVATPIWIMIGTFLAAFVILRWTYFGRDIYAVGGNIDAARLSGIRVSRTLIAAYAVAGLCSGLAGVIQAGRLGAASPLVGQDIPLNAAAGVLLGGTSFTGGVGGVTGTAVGVLFIGVLQNGLSIAGISSFWQEVVVGAILVLAIGIDRLQQNPSGRFRRRGGASAHGPTSQAEPVNE